jgi:hypothetical protein
MKFVEFHELHFNKFNETVVDDSMNFMNENPGHYDFVEVKKNQRFKLLMVSQNFETIKEERKKSQVQSSKHNFLSQRWSIVQHADNPSTIL